MRRLFCNPNVRGALLLAVLVFAGLSGALFWLYLYDRSQMVVNPLTGQLDRDLGHRVNSASNERGKVSLDLGSSTYENDLSQWAVFYLSPTLRANPDATHFTLQWMDPFTNPWTTKLVYDRATGNLIEHKFSPTNEHFKKLMAKKITDDLIHQAAGNGTTYYQLKNVN